MNFAKLYFVEFSKIRYRELGMRCDFVKKWPVLDIILREGDKKNGI